MDEYHFGADLLDTFQSAPDAIKALIVLSGPMLRSGWPRCSCIICAAAGGSRGIMRICARRGGSSASAGCRTAAIPISTAA